MTDSSDHNFGEIRIDSYNYLPVEKIFNFHIVTILIKSVVIRIKITTTVTYFQKKVC